MREAELWTDFLGQDWPIVQSVRRLKFKYPAHAALRAHVFRCDGFACRRCPARVTHPPKTYDGRHTLNTNTMVSSGWPDVLILDHVLTPKAGGRNVVENLQTLCETCNKRQQREDRAAALAYSTGGRSQ